MNPINNKSYIYIVECNGVYKIGVSVLPEQRISLIRTDNYQPIRTVAILEVLSGYGVERYAHTFLKSLGVHVRGEWFRLSCSDEEIIDYIQAIDYHVSLPGGDLYGVEEPWTTIDKKDIHSILSK